MLAPVAQRGPLLFGWARQTGLCKQAATTILCHPKQHMRGVCPEAAAYKGGTITTQVLCADSGGQHAR